MPIILIKSSYKCLKKSFFIKSHQLPPHPAHTYLKIHFHIQKQDQKFIIIHPNKQMKPANFRRKCYSTKKAKTNKIEEKTETHRLKLRPTKKKSFIKKIVSRCELKSKGFNLVIFILK